MQLVVLSIGKLQRVKGKIRQKNTNFGLSDISGGKE